MLQYTDHIENKSLFEIIRRTCNCVDKRLMDHGLRVAYIVSIIMRKIGKQNTDKLRDICFLTMLHDIGAYKTEEISSMLVFETEDMWNHSIYGYLFLKYFSPLQDIAPAVLYHHTPWKEIKDESYISDEIKLISQVIHIADRIDVFMCDNHGTWENCSKKIEEGRGERFSPVLVDLVLDIGVEYNLQAYIENGKNFGFTEWGNQLSQEEVTGYLKMLIYIIDFRSRHTVTHTVTTTNISYEIGKRLNLNKEYLDKIVCGALLHDVGKIGVPVEILKYPGKLSPQAMKIMRGHVDITKQIFGGQIEETIQNIALRHHEKLDGSGYPLELKGEDLTIGERIVAVADIVSALSGTRSYKNAYSKERVQKIISELKDENKIDGKIVDVINCNYDDIMNSTRIMCQPILDKYWNIKEDYIYLRKRYIDNI